MATPPTLVAAAREPDRAQVVHIRLMHIEEMFEMRQTDLFSEYRNWRTGIESCLSELRSRASRRPVRLEIALPESERVDIARFRATLRRYCEQRITYDARERRALRLGGVSALRVGLPLAIAGIIITAFSRAGQDSSATTLVADHLGWVLAWLGLWYPLDQFLFFPLEHRREERALSLLRDADVVVQSYRPAPSAAA
jgi:hypothetical protein